MNVFQAIELDAKMTVQAQTWGHLYPKPGNVYEGFIEWSEGGYCNGTLLNASFEGLSSSPRLYDDINDILHRIKILNGFPKDGIWRWDGKYRVLKNGNCWFSKGAFRLIHEFN